MTTEEKLDPAKISGTGKGGRLTKGDVLSHGKSKPPAQPLETARRPTKRSSRVP